VRVVAEVKLVRHYRGRHSLEKELTQTWLETWVISGVFSQKTISIGLWGAVVAERSAKLLLTPV
jgi:hypothetical protein